MEDTRSTSQKRSDDVDSSFLPGIYSEDIVRSKDGKKIGIVLKTAEDEYSDESSDEEEEDEEEKVQKGQLLVGWYHTDSKKLTCDEVVDEKSVELEDRSILPGDVVRWRNKANGSQKAQIVDVDVMVDVKIIGMNFTLHNLNAKKSLNPLTPYSEDETIVMDPWMGYIRSVTLHLTLRLKNGSRCIIEGDSVEQLLDITDMRDEDSTYYNSAFYPGQQVQGVARVFKDAKWITGTKPAISNHGRIKAIVEEVSLDSINVEWQLCGYSSQLPPSSVETKQPPTVLDRTVINSGKVICTTENSREYHLQLGDKAFYTLTDEDVNNYQKYMNENKIEKKSLNTPSNQATSSSIATDIPDDVEDDDDNDDTDGDEAADAKQRPQPPSQRRSNVTGRPRRKRHAHLPKRKKRYQPPINVVAGQRICVEICGIKTFADTIWQDGSEKQGVPSTELSPVMHMDEKEYFPGDFIVDKRGDPNAPSKVERFGVVQSSDDEARIVNVCWLKFENDTTKMTQDPEEDVSVYDIEDHQDYTFRIGEVIVRLATETTQGSDNNKEKEEKISPAGMVLKVNPDGTIQVRWINGTITSVLPSQVFQIGKDNVSVQSYSRLLFLMIQAAYNCVPQEKNVLSKDVDVENQAEADEFDTSDDDMNDEGDQDDDDAEEWETASDNSDDDGGGLQDNIAVQNQLQQNMNPLEDVIMRSLAALQTTNSTSPVVVELDQRATDFLQALNDRFGHNNIVDLNENTAVPNETLPPTAVQAEDVSIAKEEVVGEENKDNDVGREQQNENDETSCSDGSLLNRTFSKTESFTTIDAVPSSHKFCATIFQPTNQRSFNTAVMKELKLLKTHLPEGILVKAFENRMDLYSALITGPRGTPYENGLFYFDISLPENYPAGPPLVHYHAYCTARLNPNLYEDGKVCVSLLGTWSGKGSETWTSKSTLHQVLTSIQGLILNEEPYYNEAGYEDHRGSTEGLENSRLYNEMTIVKMLQSIRHMINRPPEIFENEVIEHFKDRLPSIVANHSKWLTSDSTTSTANAPPYPLLPVSKGFQASVKRVLNDLQTILDRTDTTQNKKDTCTNG